MNTNVMVWKLIPLLFVSGMCSLTYEIVWMRELRLVFGASTQANSAVLAIFMAGLGTGGIFLGRRAQQHANPLRLYGYFELIIGISVLFTPLLILFIEFLYLKMGGSHDLGMVPSTLIRLGMSALVLGVPTFFMGGTLPAVAKSVQLKIDLGRRDLGVMYGINTLGAVAGICLVVFILLEKIGAGKTLWLAGILNIVIAAWVLTAVRFDVKATEPPPDPPFAPEVVQAGKKEPAIPANFVYAAACLAGFCFFFMEMVWYRMLTPLLGGTTYTMGVILAVALAGLAMGSLGYGVRRYTVTTNLQVLALVTGLEALCMAAPFALGDRVAVLASLLRPIGTVGMKGYIVGWFVISIICVLPASIAAGYQFPLLIGLKGRGRPNIASETGLVYAWNTLGAIAGSLVGGALLLPLLGATGAWRFNIILLCGLGAAGIVLSLRIENLPRLFLLKPGAVLLAAALLLLSQGPTAAWRHTPIGAGRVNLTKYSHNQIQDWINSSGRKVLWESEGKETALAIQAETGLAFAINGKVDGNVKKDVGTQIMAPLVGAILHPNPKQALVIGLGTGSSTGWLADIDSIANVDTVEIEKSTMEVARRSAPINQAVLDNPKVHVIIGDGREVLRTSRSRYDLIFSEPSNPYRAGIASLYTEEFYKSVAQRLAPGGYFLQWVQGYEVDSQTIKVIYATLGAVFPVVETWETRVNDLLFVCSMQETDYSIPRLRRRIDTEPFSTALLLSWGVVDLEGFLSHFIARSSLARQVAQTEMRKGHINTDDRMLVEFGFARTLGKNPYFSSMDIRWEAGKRNEDRPNVYGGEVDWNRMDIFMHLNYAMDGLEFPSTLARSEDAQNHADAFNFFVQGKSVGALTSWQAYGEQPRYPFELMVLAQSLAEQGHEAAELYAGQLGNYWPVTAEAILARLYWNQGKKGQALEKLQKFFISLRQNPWPRLEITRKSLDLAMEMAAEDKELAAGLYNVLAMPFSVYVLEAERVEVLLQVAERLDIRYLLKVIEQMEPYPIWNGKFLKTRFRVYKQTRHALADKAEKDLEIFLRYDPVRFEVE